MHLLNQMFRVGINHSLHHSEAITGRVNQLKTNGSELTDQVLSEIRDYSKRCEQLLKKSIVQFDIT